MFRRESGVAVVLEQRVFRIPSCNGAPVRLPCIRQRVVQHTCKMRRLFRLGQTFGGTAKQVQGRCGPPNRSS